MSNFPGNSYIHMLCFSVLQCNRQNFTHKYVLFLLNNLLQSSLWQSIPFVEYTSNNVLLSQKKLIKTQFSNLVLLFSKRKWVNVGGMVQGWVKGFTYPQVCPNPVLEGCNPTRLSDQQVTHSFSWELTCLGGSILPGRTELLAGLHQPRMIGTYVALCISRSKLMLYVKFIGTGFDICWICILNMVTV